MTDSPWATLGHGLALEVREEPVGLLAVAVQRVHRDAGDLRRLGGVLHAGVTPITGITLDLHRVLCPYHPVSMRIIIAILCIPY